MRILLILLFAVISFTSCNSKFFVKSDKVVQTKKGFVIFSNQGDYFLPSDIDTTVNIKTDFLSRNTYENGFRISIDICDRAYLLKYYADTLTTDSYILSVEMDYLKQNTMPKKIRKQEKKYYSLHYFNKGKVAVTYRVNNISNKVVGIYPYLSESKMRAILPRN